MSDDSDTFDYYHVSDLNDEFNYYHVSDLDDASNDSEQSDEQADSFDVYYASCTEGPDDMYGRTYLYNDESHIYCNSLYMNKTMMWTFSKAPTELESLSQNGGDEDLLIYVGPDSDFDLSYAFGDKIYETHVFGDHSRVIIISHS